MLSWPNRLRKKNDFDRAFKHGLGLREGFLSIKAVKNGLELSRFGFVVGQKVSKKATMRNKIKRRLKALVKASLPEIKKGLDIVLIVGQSPKNQDFKATEQCFDRLFKKAKIIQ